MVNLIKRIILESIKDKIITCKKCGHKWHLKDGGDDPYVCHKCNPKTLNENINYNALILYHGTGEKNKVIEAIKNNDFIYSKYNQTIYLTPNKELAMKYAEIANGNDKGVIAFRFIKEPKLKIYKDAREQYEDENSYSYFSQESRQKYKENLLSNGYDGIKTNDDVIQIFKEKINILKVIDKQLKEEDYKGSHKAPTKNYGARMDDLEKMFDAIYTNNALQEYGQNYPFDKKAIEIMQGARGQENKLIEIYRAVPKQVNTINSGDWVTITKEYANEHGEAVLDNDFKVISKVVPAYTLYTDGGSIHEWGYNP